MLTIYNESLKNKLEIFIKKVVKKGKEKLISDDPFNYYKNKNLYKSNLWVLLEDGEIVASVIIKKQKYFVSGKLKEIDFIKYPISLAIVDNNYLWASVALIQNIKMQFPMSYLLGMGGSKSKVAKIFSTLGFAIKDLPFYIKPLNLFNILTQNPLVIKYFNIITKLKLNSRNSSKNQKNIEYESKELNDFNNEDFINRIPISSFELEKNYLQLNSLAPNEIKNFIKFRFYEKNLNVGNCTLFVSQANNHKYFGNLIFYKRNRKARGPRSVRQVNKIR